MYLKCVKSASENTTKAGIDYKQLYDCKCDA
jgi:hypothetical protein